MAVQLVVFQPFAAYKRGDVITDANTVAAILASPNAVRCRPVDPPEPQTQS